MSLVRSEKKKKTFPYHPSHHAARAKKQKNAGTVTQATTSMNNRAFHFFYISSPRAHHPRPFPPKHNSDRFLIPEYKKFHSKIISLSVNHEQINHLIQPSNLPNPHQSRLRGQVFPISNLPTPINPTTSNPALSFRSVIHEKESVSAFPLVLARMLPRLVTATAAAAARMVLLRGNLMRAVGLATVSRWRSPVPTALPPRVVRLPTSIPCRVRRLLVSSATTPEFP